jgi:hypothetical protein
MMSTIAAFSRLVYTYFNPLPPQGLLSARRTGGVLFSRAWK